MRRSLLSLLFLLTREQLGWMTFLVKAHLERLLSHEDKLKRQNKTIQTSQCVIGLHLEWRY